MARARTISPKRITEENFIKCKINSRLLFIFMGCFADDAGIIINSPARIKVDAFPFDDEITYKEVDDMISDLIDNGLIYKYKADYRGSNKEFLQINDWKNDQKVVRPTYKYPKK